MFLQIAVVAVKVLLTVGNTHYTCRQRCLLTGIFHCFGIAWGEHINIAVACLPDSLVILGLETPTGITDFISLDEFLGRHSSIIEDCHPTLVGILRPLQLTFLIGAAVGTAVFGLHQSLIARQYILAAVYGSAILAQSHRNGCAVYLLVMLQDARQCHKLTITQEVLRHIGLYFRVVGLECFGRYIQIGKQEHLRQIQVAVGIFRRTVAGGSSDDIFVINAIGSKSLDGKLSRTRLHFVVGVHYIRTGGTGISLIISQPIEIAVFIEHPLGSAVVDKSVVDGRDDTLVQSLGSQQHVHRIV